LTREEFLDNFLQLLNTLKGYQELILKVEEEDLEAAKVKILVQEKINQLKFGGVNVRTMEMIGTYLRFSLEKFTGDKLQFLLPDEPNDSFFKVNDGFLELSDKITQMEGELEEIQEKVYFLTKTLPPQSMDKTRLLLRAVSSLFKSIVRKDYQDIENHVNHIHHLTANKDSFYLINEIGHMVRGIHDSLKDFSEHVPTESLDPGIVDDMPDAIDKLNLVIMRMENSANSTLDDVEALLEKNSVEQETNHELLDASNSILSSLEEMKKDGPSSGVNFDDLIEKINTKIIGKLQNHSEMLKENEAAYFRVIGNQSFQDITGQTLKKIISFIEQLEINLLNILQKYSAKFEKSSKHKETKEIVEDISPLVGTITDDGLVLEGPQDNKPDENKGDAKKQTDIDNILAQFGF